MKHASRTLLLSLACIVSSMCLASTARAADVNQTLVDIPVPFDARLQSVGNEVLHNRQRLAMATYESTLSLTDTLAYYQQLWPAVPGQSWPALVENRTPEWLILAHLQDDVQIVLQLRLAEPHRSSGFLSVMKIESETAAAALSPPLPGLERLSITHSRDGDRASVLSVYASPESPQVLARQFEAHWQDKGWTLVSSESHDTSRILLLNRDAAQLELVITDAAAEYTLIVLNEVDDHG